MGILRIDLSRIRVSQLWLTAQIEIECLIRELLLHVRITTSVLQVVLSVVEEFLLMMMEFHRVIGSRREVRIELILKAKVEGACLYRMETVLIEILALLTCDADDVAKDVVSEEVVAAEGVRDSDGDAEEHLVNRVLAQEYSTERDANAPEKREEKHEALNARIVGISEVL